jgi:DNA-binding MarR family transcriptional regulator
LRPAEPQAIDLRAGEIDSALLSVSRVLNQVRVHAMLRKRAGVELDRGGAAMLYKLATEGENVRLRDLAERLGIDSPGVTRKVQQLEAMGLVRRSPDPEDGRVSRISLTKAGCNAIERLLTAHRQWIQELLSRWPDEEQREFSRMLQLFATTIEEDLQARHGR